MQADLFDLRPAPQEIDASDGLKQLHAALDELLAPRATASPAAISPLAPTACNLLRYRLAVRGWVSPGNVMADIPAIEAASALRTVSLEVEVAERTRAGKWYMAIASRKRVFAQTDLTELRAASDRLHHDDDTDPVRLALRVALDAAIDSADPGSEALLRRIDGQPAHVLPELARMVAWGSAIPGLEAMAAAAGAYLKRSGRDRELDAVGAKTIVGRNAEQARLRNFLNQPADPQRVRTLYVSGIGGSGKSTLLLAAEKELRERGTTLAVRLDFDSAYLDPLSPEQMDIMFLSALAVEEPGLASALREITRSLQYLAEHRVRERIDAEGDFSRSSGASRRRGQGRRMRYATKSGSSAEESGSSERYERLSALYPLAKMPEFRQRGVVLFVDTMENVSRLGADAIDSVLAWLGSIAACLPRRNLLVVLAGRDTLGSSDMQALARRLQEHGLVMDAQGVDLGDLAVDDACQLLKHFGMPAADAALAAVALPRNPLVLQLAAHVYGSADANVAEIQQDYRAGRIDRQTASGYLAQRVIQHVARQPARRYAVAALALEDVTERSLRDIVIPAVDGLTAADRRLARQVYDGLRRATWLTTEEKRGTLRWHTELRKLALSMIEADPEHEDVNRRVHAAAAVWHKSRRLPTAHMRARLHEAKALSETRPERVSDFVDDELHRLRIEGVGGEAGEGDRLVARGRSALALENYRARPTREVGVPPNFVIRAQAQTGEWVNEEVNCGKVLSELRRHYATRGGTMQRSMVERLYWLTRLEMLRGTELSRAHVDLLRDACRSLKFRRQDGALFGLIGMAEALYSERGALSLIAPASWPPPRANVGPELRFSMVRTVFGRLSVHDGEAKWVSTTLGAMLLLDERWPDELIKLSEREVLQVAGGASSLAELKAQIVRLRYAPLVKVEEFVSSCRDVPLQVNLSRVDPRVAASILRGTLVEFHSPLAALLSADGLITSLGQLASFMQELARPPTAVLTLAEFESGSRRQLHEGDMRSAISAMVVMLDRARVLAEFCRQLMRYPSMLLQKDDSAAARRLLELCKRYLTWDRALNPHAAPAAAKKEPYEP